MASTVDVRMAKQEPSASETTEARSAAFLKWINHTLKSKSLSASNLGKDLESGTLLINLLQCLSPGKNMPGR